MVTSKDGGDDNDIDVMMTSKDGGDDNDDVDDDNDE